MSRTQRGPNDREPQPLSPPVEASPAPAPPSTPDPIENEPARPFEDVTEQETDDNE